MIQLNLTKSSPGALFHGLIIDCQCFLLACRSQEKRRPAVMTIIEIVITTNEFVCVCAYVCVVGVRFGGPSCHMGFDWWMADVWWWMHTHIKPIDGRTQVRRGFGSLRQCYSFIKAESHCGHRSWRWQANIMSGWVDNDAMNMRVTGWRGINICKAPAAWCEIAVMAGFLHCFECVFFVFVFWSPTNTFLAHFSFVKFFLLFLSLWQVAKSSANVWYSNTDWPFFSFIFSSLIFLLSSFSHLPVCHYLPTSWPSHWSLHNIDSLNWNYPASLVFLFLSLLICLPNHC